MDKIYQLFDGKKPVYYKYNLQLNSSFPAVVFIKLKIQFESINPQ